MARGVAAQESERQAIPSGRRRAHEAGLRVGQKRARSRASRAGREAAETEVGRQQREAAAQAAAVEPQGPPTPTGTSCPPPYSFSMGTCTLYNSNSCGPGQTRVHATLECIPGDVPAVPSPSGAVCEGIDDPDEYLNCLRANGE